jgi:GNAT superfamily N-acetyltransferase
MNRHDLDLLDEVVLATAREVVPMLAVHEGARQPDVIGLRHDVDENPGSLDTAVKIARWEADRGYRATFFILHTARYWRDERRLRGSLASIAECGHEIGIHANAIAAALRGQGDPHLILEEAIGRLRSFGHPVVGVAPHGDGLCRDAAGRVWFVNDEQFVECARPEMGSPDRLLQNGETIVRLNPKPLADFGLVYETNSLPRGRYLSDSGGRWSSEFAVAVSGPGQLHILWHPDWWQNAFRGGRLRRITSFGSLRGGIRAAASRTLSRASRAQS